MKKGIFLWLALMAGAVPAYAGHGTIVETDTAFIVDYSDVKDKATDNVEKAAPAVVREIIPAQQPAVAAALPAADDKKPAATAPKLASNKHVIPRQRRGTRTGPWHRPESMIDTPSDSED